MKKLLVWGPVIELVDSWRTNLRSLYFSLTLTFHNFLFSINLIEKKHGCSGQLTRTSTILTGPEVNDHVSLQLSSY
jgi:hypothetical protein